VTRKVAPPRYVDRAYRTTPYERLNAYDRKHCDDIWQATWNYLLSLLDGDVDFGVDMPDIIAGAAAYAALDAMAEQLS